MDVEFVGPKSCASPSEYFSKHSTPQHCKGAAKP